MSSHLAYVLMHAKRGVATLDACEAELPRGALLEVSNARVVGGRPDFVNAVSIDRPEITVTLLFKELMPIERDAYLRLLPLKPHERYVLVTDPHQMVILSADVGELVWVELGDQTPDEVGVLRYIGPIVELGPGHFFGVELLEGKHGKTSGKFGSHRYFDAPPYSSVFVTCARLRPYVDDRSTMDGFAVRRFVEDAAASIDRLRLTDAFEARRGPESKSSKSSKTPVQSPVESAPPKSTETTTTTSEPQVNVGDRIVWLSDDRPEFGIVKWIGHVPGDDDFLAGVEFDNAVGKGTGTFQGRQLFEAQLGHASLVPLAGLMLASDFEEPVESEKSDRDKTGEKKNNNKSDFNRSSRSHPPSPGTGPSAGRRRGAIREFISKHTGEKRSAKSNSLPRTFSTKEQITFDTVANDVSSNNYGRVEEGTMVELRRGKDKVYGVVRFIGFLPQQSNEVAGIELEDEVVGGGNGYLDGKRYFDCPPGKGVFVPFSQFALDSRFHSHGNITENRSESSQNGFDSFEPPMTMDRSLFGRRRGVQGHQNSCYLDATLFAMFAFADVFDHVLYRKRTRTDIQEYDEVQRVLREDVVHPLRRQRFVAADKVMRLRRLLDHLTSVRGLLSEEKDPEEFLQSLLSQTLRCPPFLTLSSGQTSHLFQLFVDRDEHVAMPSVQELFDQSFLNSDIKLKSVPAALILQMPRFGSQYKVYDRIRPTLRLDITDVIENSPRQCTICGCLASHECLECFGANGSVALETTTFCLSCLQQVHSHHKRRAHAPRELLIPRDFRLNSKANFPRLYMDLFAVLCIETSHYVTFAKCGASPASPWCFFDSMADREGEENGFNIPEVSEAPEVSSFLQETNNKYVLADKKDLPAKLRRLLYDNYLCFYSSTNMSKY